ncbi:hypothetical protein B566_EDAN006067 [Ephemera danica]|nr:hypothetical protein B566_EDAN006067 [Ephemera danica]
MVELIFNKMSIPYSGTLKRSAGVISAIAKQLRSVTLKPAKKVVIKFDPFHDKVAATREFLFHISTPKVLETNLNCKVKAEVLSDRTGPLIEVSLVDGGKIMPQKNPYNVKLIETLYNQVPSFTDVFDEDTWYIFAACFTLGTILVAVILSRFITIKPLD